jgi:hypothetical protein
MPVGVRIAAIALLAMAAPAQGAPDVPPMAPAAPTPGDATLAVAPGELADVLDRLRGQRVTVAADRRSVSVDDIAGEGRPWIGAVERRGDALWLIAASGALRLTGALARPRIAGPGYTVWATGRRDGDALVLRRIGVLRRPRATRRASRRPIRRTPPR